MGADSHSDDDTSSIDDVVVSDRQTFWAAIHKMSRPDYRPSRWSGVWGSPWSANAHRGTLNQDDGRTLRGVRLTDSERREAVRSRDRTRTRDRSLEYFARKKKRAAVQP